MLYVPEFAFAYSSQFLQSKLFKYFLKFFSTLDLSIVVRDLLNETLNVDILPVKL